MRQFFRPPGRLETMARRTQKDAESTRENILASALSLFLENGYARTSLDDIARAIKMTKGAVYWHFATKEALLMALIDRALERFRAMMALCLPPSGYTFPAVAEAMVKSAVRTIEDDEMRQMFLLMRTQVRWGNTSMEAVRESLLSDKTFGPKQAFMMALENDLAAGRIRKGVDSEQVIEIALALWAGLIQSKIDGFLKAPLDKTLESAYNATWNTIRIENRE